jgi:integrase
MKGGKRGYDAEIGPKLTTLFGRYLETYWPVLLGQAGLSTADARFPLWLSIRGTRMCESAIYKAVCRRTKAALGTAVNPHRFRHAIATTVAIELPEHTPIVTPLLGHLDEETAEQAYNLATSLQAGGRYGAALDALCFGTGEPDAA